MKTGMFTVGMLTGLAGAAAAAVAVNYKLAGTGASQTISGTAHKTANAVSHAAHETADTVDRMIT